LETTWSWSDTVSFYLVIRDGTSYTYSMNLSKMIAELRTEQEHIDQAILMFERIAAGRGKRRGRPPAWMAQVKQVKRRGRPPGSRNKAKNGS
jgi:hypothetical protein